MWRYSCALAALSAIAVGAPLNLVKSIPLPNVKGRLGQLSADVRGQRLFVAGIANNSVEVVDLKSGKVIKSIGGMRGPQGVVYVPDANRLIVTNRDDGSILFLDATTFQVMRTINKLTDADCVRYDSRTKTIVAGYGEGLIGFFDLTGKQLGEVRVDSHPESFQVERNGNRLFANLPTSNNIAMVNTDAKLVTRTIPIAEVSGNYAMALDEKNSRLFIIPKRPPKVLILDSASGRLIDDRRTVGDAEDAFYDGNRGRLYVIGGDGNIDVIRQTRKDRYEPVATVPTVQGARTGLFVDEWNRLFLAVPARQGQAAEIRIYETGE